jgi:magnesium transporter
MIETVFAQETRGFKWLDIVNPTPEELQKLAHDYDLHNTSIEDCLDPKHQPKFERVGDIVFIINRAFDHGCNPKTDSVFQLTRKIAMFIGESFMITIHRSDMDFLTDLKDKWRHKSVDESFEPSGLLFELFKSIVLSYASAIEELEQTLEQFERTVFSNENTSIIIKDIHWFRSRVLAIRRIFRQSYDVLLKIDDYTEEVAPFHQDVRERLERFITTTDALRDASSDILNTHLALAAHKTNRVIRILTIFSVFFLPLTFIVGVYGMNFEYMPELRWKNGYLGSWLLMILTTLFIYLWFKVKGWLK